MVAIAASRSRLGWAGDDERRCSHGLQVRQLLRRVLQLDDDEAGSRPEVI